MHELEGVIEKHHTHVNISFTYIHEKNEIKKVKVRALAYEFVGAQL